MYIYIYIKIYIHIYMQRNIHACLCIWRKRLFSAAIQYTPIHFSPSFLTHVVKH